MRKRAAWPYDWTGFGRKKDKSVPLPLPIGDIMYDDDGVWLSIGDGIQIDVSPVLKNGADYDEDPKTKAMKDGAKKRLKKRK